ncbi:MAG: DeoR/GlpR family DNA-binding transcription regulator [Burkholderiaceae bacterium]|jgi:DeoR family fructose operon transcriptional repressor
MWAHERHSRIVALLNERQRLTTESFSTELGVSKETIRRDLIELELSGKLSRVHGGAIPQSVPIEPSYVEREELHRPEKRAIARAAATLILPGMSCFIDAGSTTQALAQALLSRTDIQIITNSVSIASDLASNPGLDVVLLGGRIAQEMPATYGDQTVAEIGRYHLDLAIVSPVGIDPRAGAMDYLWHEAAVARAMLEHARQRILLADRSKLGQTSRMQICAASAVDVLVTNSLAGDNIVRQLQAGGVKNVLHAGRPGTHRALAERD